VRWPRYAGVCVCLAVLLPGCAAYRAGSSAAELLPEIDIIKLRDDATAALNAVQQVRREIDDLSRRLAALERSATAVPAAPAPEPVGGPPDQAEARPAPRDTVAEPRDEFGRMPTGALYQSGLEAFQQRGYERAGRLFAEVLTRDSAGPYAENARYWMGECRYAQSAFAEALELFRLVSAPPESAKDDDALLKQGLCLVRLERRSEARVAFETLLSRYPGSEFAERARDYLARVR